MTVDMVVDCYCYGSLYGRRNDCTHIHGYSSQLCGSCVLIAKTMVVTIEALTLEGLSYFLLTQTNTHTISEQEHRLTLTP